MDKNIKIGLYCGSWGPNIGNAFFDLGAKATLKLAFPDSIIYHIGGCSHWLLNLSARANNLKECIGNSIEIGEFAELDVIVFAGMSMCNEFVDNNGITFLRAQEKNGLAVLILGGGAAYYTKEESSYFADFCRKLKKLSIITRDEDTYALFADKIDNIWSGIDSAFFLPDFYRPPKLLIPKFDVECFDSMDEIPHINHTSEIIINLHHCTFGISKASHISKSRTLISDVPEDYLTIYSQVNETHTDRVHACVATLAYGNKARFYGNTPREALFNKVGVNDIRSNCTQIDNVLLNELKTSQVEKTREFINKMTK